MTLPSLWVTIPTLIGSCSSFVACTIFFVLHFAFPPKRHWRQALVVNLLVADLINSANNTISGIVTLVLRKSGKSLSNGSACTVNAWIGQFSVQAVDFNILIISVVVLLIILQNSLVTAHSTRMSIGVCLLPWIPPLITSSLGVYLGVYGPVSGNWCWISRDHLGIRYALTHGWRIAIFLAVIAIYTYVYIYISKVFGHCVIFAPGTSLEADDITRSECTTLPDLRKVTMPAGVAGFNDNMSDCSTPPKGSELEVKVTGSNPSSAPKGCHASLDEGRKRRKSAIKRSLILNGYPILYMILWIPGIVNRIMEHAGPVPLWLQALQATTQFVGVANTLTYSYKERKSRRRMHQPTSSL